MPETLTLPETVQTPPIVAAVDRYISDGFVDYRRQALDASLNGQSDISMMHIGRLREQAALKREEGFVRWEAHQDYKGQRELEAKANRLNEVAIVTFGPEAILEYLTLRMARENLDEGNIYLWGDEAKSVYDQLIATPQIDDGLSGKDLTPPAKREDATRQDYVSYLEKKLFVDPEDLKLYDGENLTYKNGRLIRLMASDKPYVIPMSNVVSAGSFDNWAGGSGNKSYQNSDGVNVEGPPINAIMDYAKRTTPLPNVEKVYAFVQPNGIVIYEVAGSNHRTAAAIAQGKDTIEVSGDIEVYSVDTNFVSANRLKHPNAGTEETRVA